jgi:hypothetical protein
MQGSPRSHLLNVAGGCSTTNARLPLFTGHWWSLLWLKRAGREVRVGEDVWFVLPTTWAAVWDVRSCSGLVARALLLGPCCSGLVARALLLVRGHHDCFRRLMTRARISNLDHFPVVLPIGHTSSQQCLLLSFGRRSLSLPTKNKNKKSINQSCRPTKIRAVVASVVVPCVPSTRPRNAPVPTWHSPVCSVVATP